MILSRGDSLLAQVASSRTYYEVMRLRQLDEWWHWLLLFMLCLIVLVAVSTVYFRDSRQLARGKRWLLIFLRITAFVGLLVFFLDLQKRTEQKLIKNSRFAVLVDTSQSMGIADQPVTDSTNETRIAQVVRALSKTELITELQQKHDVAVYRFDETNLPTPVAAFPQLGETESDGAVTLSSVDVLREFKQIWAIALGMLALAVAAFIAHWVLGNIVRTVEGESWALLVGVLALIVGVVLIGVANLRHPQIHPRVAFGFPERPTTQSGSASDADKPADTTIEAVSPKEVDWATLLEPAGDSTRLGDAIGWIIQQERGNPLAGIAVVTDGNGNRGIEPSVAMQLAKDAEIPIYPIGVASDTPPRNVRLVDLEAPARVYPGDEFKLTGYLQAYGMESKNVSVKLLSQPDGGDNTTEFLEEELVVPLGADGAVTPLALKVTPNDVGKRVYWLRLANPDIDDDASDNQVSAKVQIVDRKTRVLLVAGGPTREYRFVRNMLFRDKDITLDVLLQTAGEGASQESNKLLEDLPTDASEMFQYDCLIAFDPDWVQFDRQQLELLETWVAEKAGGMVCLAGPVHTSSWAETRSAPPQVEVIRQLYPVRFYSMSANRIKLGQFESETAWPLEITKEGRAASFLSLGDEEQSGVDVWERFPGVYGFYPTRDVKPAAAVFARHSDPQKASDDQQPPLIVGQFYGAGRVVFVGTGEFWRLRAVDDAYFERFYTKLIRYVSEGRLLRDSNRGLLLVDKDRALRGDAIAVRASVTDQQFQPLKDSVVDVLLRGPDNSQQKLELRRADAERDGMYAGRFMATQAGDYQLSLALQGDGAPVILEREVRVRLPNLEIERPQRNDRLLQQFAQETGGQYLVGMPSGADGSKALASVVSSKRRETFLPGTPDRAFQRRLMVWLLVLICGVLFLEWLVRRLSKLA